MAVGDAYVFPGFLTPVLTLLFFQSHRLLFSHASAEVRGENTPERKVASTWDRTHNHQVMSPTRSPLSHPGGLVSEEKIFKEFAKKFHLVAMATRVFDGIKFCEQVLKRTSQGTFLPSLVQIGPAV